MKQHLDKFKEKPFSWSSISSWEFNKESWARKYLDGIYDPDSEELKFGKYIDEKIQKDPEFLPHLPRYEKMQHKMKVMFGDILLVGIPDGIDFKGKRLADYKTGKKEWTIQRAKETGQLKFYLLLLYITEKIKPEEFDCYIHWLPTKLEENGNFERKISLIKEDDIRTFKVKHTMADILKFGQYIKQTYKEMCDYALKYGLNDREFKKS